MRQLLTLLLYSFLLVSTLASCATDRASSSRLATASSCSTKEFAKSFLAYRNSSGSQELWETARCNLGEPRGLSDAYSLQAEYIEERSNAQPVVGYKVALGSVGAQKLLGAPSPVTGVLFSDALIASGSVLSKKQAQLIAVEADLLATIESVAVNRAKTVEEVAQHIRSVSAYMEIPDLLLPMRNDMAARFVATNSGAYLGVVGNSTSSSQSKIGKERLMNSLAAMTVELRDATGKVLATSGGSSLMGHPYAAILFLMSRLHAQGEQLQAGDQISLGAYSKPIAISSLPENAAREISVHYLGLIDQKERKTLSAKVSFR
ncbi:MAG: hypothetical protein AB8B86_06820 [Pseudomonadales bacterium]